MPKSSKPRSSSGPTNAVPRTGASSKVGKGRATHSMNKKVGNGGGHLRSAETIRRLKLYNSKTIRNKAGKTIGGQFLMGDRAGDREITAGTGRIAPDRRWFGNTRVVDPKQLDTFREAMTTQQADPYSVVLKRKALPMGLLQDAAEMTAGNNTGMNNKALLEQEPFDQAFGKRSRRKRVKIDQLLMARVDDKDGKKGTNGKVEATDPNVKLGVGGQAHVVEKKDHEGNDNNAYAKLLQVAQTSHSTYDERNNRVGIVPWGRDSDLVRTEGENVDWRHERKDDLFLKGQSKRIWAEFFKVVDCSDVVLHVIDARNVPGTRCTVVENHIRDNAKHKHLVFVLNKIDLVPNWVAKRWMGELAKHRPTIAFHASMTHAFGKGALISLLRQFGKLHEDKKQISVGVVGYPNVGKSSVINTLISKKSCNVAPIPGETKIWQYITLFKRIALIDCPGVVVDTAGDTETDSVLKGVVRAERLESPEEFIPAIIDRVQRQHIHAQYKLTTTAQREWETTNDLLETIATKCGRLLKGGEPCRRTAAIMLINDYQRGRLPHYIAPPELKEDEEPSQQKEETAEIKGIKQISQDLDKLDDEAVTMSEMAEAKKQSELNDEESDDDDDDEVPSSSALVAAAAGQKWDEE